MKKENKYIKNKQKINKLIIWSFVISLVFLSIFLIYGINTGEKFFSIDLHQSYESFKDSKNEEYLLNYEKKYNEDCYILPIKRQELVSIINNIKFSKTTKKFFIFDSHKTEISDSKYKNLFYERLLYFYMNKVHPDTIDYENINNVTGYIKNSNEDLFLNILNDKNKVNKNGKISEKLKNLNERYIGDVFFNKKDANYVLGFDNSLDSEYKTVYTLAYYPEKDIEEALVLYSVENPYYIENNNSQTKYTAFIRKDTKEYFRNKSQDFHDFILDLDKNKLQEQDKSIQQWFKLNNYDYQFISINNIFFRIISIMLIIVTGFISIIMVISSIGSDKKKG